MHTPKIEESICIARIDLAKDACSGEREHMASLNSLALGREEVSNGIRTSSLFCKRIASIGVNWPGHKRLPMIRGKQENWRARAEIFFLSNYPCKYWSPTKSTVVAASRGINIVLNKFSLETQRENVLMHSVLEDSSKKELL